MKKMKLWLTYAIFSVFILGVSTKLSAQVGIGTTTPDASAILDLTSTEQGLLAPRMTTAERTAISSPAVGLLVFDTDEGAFFHSNGTDWVKIASNDEIRDNYKIVKSDADLADELIAGGGTKYLLDENTLYEINGTITLAAPIDSNNSYIRGNDVGEDVIRRFGGPVFQGSTGLSIRSLTIVAISGGSIFDLTLAATERVVIQGSVFAGAAGSTTGTIDGGSLVFMSIVQCAGFTNGITFNGTGATILLLNNVGWLDTNTGTMQTFTGTFDIIGQIGGFFFVDAGEIGIDVSSDPVVSGTGTLQIATFEGAGDFVNSYTTASDGFNFSTEWDVNCNGLPIENDFTASGNIFYNGDIVTGFNQAVPATSGAFNLEGITGSNTTTAVNLFRVSSPQDNRLQYSGRERRTFQVNASLAVRGNDAGNFYAFLIVRNGTDELVETNTLMRVNDINDINSLAIIGTVELDPGDYIELWAQRLTGTGAGSVLSIFSLNLSIN